MDRELFAKQINLMKSFNYKIDQIRDFGIDLVETPLFDIPAQMFDNFISAVCTDEGEDLVFWWMYENVEKVIFEHDEEGNEKKIPLETVYQLYEYLDENDLLIV